MVNFKKIQKKPVNKERIKRVHLDFLLNFFFKKAFICSFPAKIGFKTPRIHQGQY
ncbi:Hypothetical protein Minf_1161 [Methylacidiphilum infernorum V4]|uniref:Uncharacterized protein n=1 Tax=Methylacidiphilum infernorum (isolate V4) TaxID=481448 RepID=B3DV63_METI4|nr:Hypothetical protein Minf_1161 [Methylacidiphilum infernorum V4]